MNSCTFVHDNVTRVIFTILRKELVIKHTLDDMHGDADRNLKHVHLPESRNIMESRSTQEYDRSCAFALKRC